MTALLSFLPTDSGTEFKLLTGDVAAPVDSSPLERLPSCSLPLIFSIVSLRKIMLWPMTLWCWSAMLQSQHYLPRKRPHSACRSVIPAGLHAVGLA
jgi:hypothetical protein